MIPDYIIDLGEYKEVQHIGSGAYGDVYLVEQIKMKKLYAAKIFRKEISSAKDQKIFFQELITYSKVKHNSILSLQGFNMMNFDDEHKPTIITNYMKNGSLDEYLKKNPELSSSNKYIILLGIAEGMKYLHSNGIIHLDLKPGNVLLDDNIFPRICDFGISKISDLSLSIEFIKSFNGTPLYMAPEIIKGDPYTYKVDVYSFSIIAYELITGKEPYVNVTSPFALMTQVSKGKRPDLSVIKNEEIQFLLSSWWKEDPRERPNFNQIVDQIKKETFKKAMNANENDINNYHYFLYEKLPPLNNSNSINQLNKFNINKNKSLSSLKSPIFSPKKKINFQYKKYLNSSNDSLCEKPKPSEFIIKENQRNASEAIIDAGLNDKLERFQEQRCQYTYQRQRCSILSSNFNTKDLLGINNVVEIELAPNHYFKCVFSSIENNVLDKYISVMRFEKAVSYHFSSSPNGQVSYFSMCTGRDLFVLVNPTNFQLNLIIHKLQNYYLIPCGLNDKDQLFFYDYLNKINNIASDTDVQQIIVEINKVKNAVYPRQFSYDILFSYERLLFIAYSTFLGYYIRSQFIEPIKISYESKKFEVKDFITLRGILNRKVIALNWPEGKVYILKRYLDEQQFNESLQYFKKKRMSCIVPFFGEAKSDRKYLVFGFPSRGTLKEVLSNQYLDLKTCRKITIQLVFGLAYLNMVDAGLDSISADNISIDWNYNAYFTEYDEDWYWSTEEGNATDLSNVLCTLLTYQRSSPISSIFVKSIYEPIPQIYELCKKSKTTACDIVSEILNNNLFFNFSSTINKLLSELPNKFVIIDPLNDYRLKYLKANCNDKNTLNYIKTIQFGQIITFHFFYDRILIFQSGDICATLINPNQKIVNIIISKMRNSIIVPLETRDLDILFEINEFEFILNLMEKQQLQAARLRIKKIIDAMNQFNDKILIAKTLALSYALTHEYKKVDETNFIKKQLYLDILIDMKTEIPVNLLRTVELFNNFFVKCLYSTEDDFTFNEFVEEFGYDKFVTVHFKIDEITGMEYISFCTSKKLLLLQTQCSHSNYQVNKTIEHIKTSKVYCISPEDRTSLFKFPKFDIIQSFATYDEMINLKEETEELFRSKFSSNEEQVTYSKYFKLAIDVAIAYYVISNPEYIESDSSDDESNISTDNDRYTNAKEEFENCLKATKRDDPLAYFNIGLMYLRGHGCEKDMSKAAEYFDIAAPKGNQNAQINLGFMYAKGEGVPKNKYKAFDLFKLAASQGNAEAQFNLGKMYEKGDGIQQNYKEAIKFYEKAAAQNHSKAQLYLGVMYDIGEGVSVDKSKATKFFIKSYINKHEKLQSQSTFLPLSADYDSDKPSSINSCSSKSSDNSIVLLSHSNEEEELFEQNKDSYIDIDTDNENVKEFQIFSNEAQKGDSTALFNLGLMYSRGQGCHQNNIKAAEFYNRAAALGNLKAQLNLANMYLKGNGIPEDISKAAILYELTASKGNIKSQYNLGVMYLNGDNFIQSYSKAIYYLEKAASQNHSNAQLILGFMYDHGEGVLVNKNRAIDLYKKSAENHHPYAYYNLALIYHKGEPGIIEKDIMKAIKYYSLAAEYGIGWAMFNLGLLYSLGDGVEIDQNKAMYFFEMASNQSYPEAQVNLGIIYYNKGESYKKEASKFFKKAANQNIPEAQFNLGYMYDEGIGVKKNPQKAVNYYKLASDQNIHQASFNLAILYSKGDDGVP